MPRLTIAKRHELFERGLKNCSRCDTIKTLDQFQVDASPNNQTGRQPWCRLCRRKDGKELYERMRMEALRKYSVTPYPSCVCCGETVIQFLGLDHINGGGRQHRRTVGNGYAYYRWLKKHEWPDGFQTMCHNCNQAKGQCGRCPHEDAR